jgi:LPS export ABC transporter protein LptC
LNSRGKISFISHLYTLTLVISLVSVSCSKKIEVIKKSDIESYPTMTVREFRTEYSDSAKKQVVMTSSLMERYSNKKPPYSEFTKGINVLFYDGHKEPVGFLSSKYAKVTEDKRIWELKDSVVVINEKHDTLETELLYWDQGKELVYTDRFVKISSVDRVTMGTGFEANSRLTWYQIRNISSDFYIKDEK